MRKIGFTSLVLCGMVFGQDEIISQPVFGMIGIGVQQTLRVGVVGLEGGCTAVLGFRDASGMPVAVGDKRVELAEHHADFHDFSPTLMRGRLEARPMVQIVAGACATSAALFERLTGRTLAHAHKHRAAAPSTHDIHFPPIGGAAGQRLRLGVVGGDTGGRLTACRGEMVFHDARGVEIGAAVRFDLGSGQAAFRDLAITSLRRGEVIPCVRPGPAGDIQGCVASMQVIESLTDWTTGYLIPCI